MGECYTVALSSMYKIRGSRDIDGVAYILLFQGQVLCHSKKVAVIFRCLEQQFLIRVVGVAEVCEIEKKKDTTGELCT